jgi:hypothetical protein
MAAKNPFADDDTDEIRRANERDSEKVREAADEEVKPPKGDEDVVEIDLNEVEKEEADKAEREDRGGRQERRRDRYREQTEAARAAEERAAAAERERDEERTRRIAYETQIATQQRAPQQEADPEGAEILRVRAERESVHAAYQARVARGGITPQEEQEFRAKAYELNDREDQAKFLRNQRMHGGGQRGLTQQDVAREAQKQYLLNTFPDVFTHPDKRVLQYVSATHDQLLAAGHRPGNETLQMAISATRKQFRLGPQQRAPEPNEASRRRLSGGGTGGGGGRPVAGGDEPTVVKMSAAQRKMAEAAFGHLPPAAAHKQWAKTVGKKLAQKGV